MNNKRNLSAGNFIILIGLILMGGLYYSSRFMMEGIPYYLHEDTYFHLNRLIGLGNVWEAPVNFNAFESDGSLANIFYPWLTIYPMRILFMITHNHVLAYKLYYLLLSIGTELIAYYSMERISRNKISAFCFANLYTFSAYRFADVFRRQALGECLAITFLPIVLCGIYLILFDDSNRWITLSAGMALIAYSHLLSVMMSALMLGMLLVIAFFFIDNKAERLIALTKAAAVTIFLSFGAVVPVIHYYYDGMHRPRGSGELAQNTSFSIRTLLISAIKNETTAHHVGVLVVAAFIIGCILLGVQFRKNVLTREQLTAITVFMATSLLLFLATSSLLPWYYLGEKTILGNIQFVWRLNAYPTLLVLAAFSWLLPISIRNKQISVMALALIIAATALLHFTSIIRLHKEEVHRIKETEIRTSMIEHHKPYFDYAPEKAFQYYSENGYTLNDCYVNDTKAGSIQEISNHGTRITFRMHVNKGQSMLDIPVFYNDRADVRVNNTSVMPEMSKRGTLLITYMGEEGNIVVSVENHYDYIMITSWIISVITASFLFLRTSRSRRNTNN